MNGMGYEYFVRKVYQCERDYRRGADAAIYRKMEIAETNLSSVTENKTQEQKEHEYQSAFREVKKHVLHSVTDGLQQLRLKVTPAENEMLQSIIYVVRTNFYNKKTLDELITKADTIFNLHGLSAAS